MNAHTLLAAGAAAHAARVGSKAPSAHREMNRGEPQIGWEQACERARHQAERAEAEVGKAEDEREAARRHGIPTPAPSLS